MQQKKRGYILPQGWENNPRGFAKWGFPGLIFLYRKKLFLTSCETQQTFLEYEPFSFNAEQILRQVED